jgi:hypothetical protein
MGKASAEAKPAYWAWRLNAVRLFAQHRALRTCKPKCPCLACSVRCFAGAAYIYSAEEIQALLKAAATLRCRMRPHTCVTLFGLLASTGLGVGEALGLNASTSILQPACSR